MLSTREMVARQRTRLSDLATRVMTLAQRADGFGAEVDRIGDTVIRIDARLAAGRSGSEADGATNRARDGKRQGHTTAA